MTRAFVLACASLAACAPTLPPHRSLAPSTSETPPPPPLPEPATDAGALADAGPRDPLLVLADQITERVAVVRGLAPRSSIASGLLSRDAILARVRARIDEEYRPGELDREGLLYRTIGLWNDPRDYARTTFSLLEEQIAGFYDPTRKQLYVASWLSPLSQGPTLAHEITHALQDQHFDISRFTTHRQGSGDRQLAAMTVVEGDATLSMLGFVSGRRGLVSAGSAAYQSMARGGTGGEQLQSAPLMLRETLVFPYREGLRLCTEAYARNGWNAVNELLRNPPASTEQVLHRDKLASREAPIELSATAPPSLSATHEVVFHETLGELGVQLWLRTWLSPDVSDEAAGGWGGDSAALLLPRASASAGADAGTNNQVTPVSLWRIAMDPSPDDREALELERAVVGLLRQRYPRARRVRLDGVTHALATSASTVSLVAHRGSAVVVLEGVAPAIAATAAREALATP